MRGEGGLQAPSSQRWRSEEGVFHPRELLAHRLLRTLASAAVRLELQPHRSGHCVEVRRPQTHIILPPSEGRQHAHVAVTTPCPRCGWPGSGFHRAARITGKKETQRAALTPRRSHTVSGTPGSSSSQESEGSRTGPMTRLICAPARGNQHQRPRRRVQNVRLGCTRRRAVRRGLVAVSREPRKEYVNRPPVHLATCGPTTKVRPKVSAGKRLQPLLARFGAADSKAPRLLRTLTACTPRAVVAVCGGVDRNRTFPPGSGPSATQKRERSSSRANA